jgi:hypothetical protein
LAVRAELERLKTCIESAKARLNDGGLGSAAAGTATGRWTALWVAACSKHCLVA